MSRGAQAPQLLRCSAFEEFMLDQDAPEHPCVICLRLELEGELDGPRMSRALVAVAQRHPLLRAKLESRWGKLWWQIQPDVAVELQVHADPAPAWPTARYFDLMHTVGLQADLFPAESSQPNILFLQIHHALADGLGCLQVVEDLLAEYASPCDRSTPSDSIDMAQRNRFGLDAIQILRLIPKQCVGLAGVRQFLMRRPVPLSCGQNNHTEAVRLTALKHQLTREQTELLKQNAKQHGATLNDYLACIVFETCDELRRDQAAYNQTAYNQAEWLRMMVPMSLRNAQTQQLSACNVVSCVFLDRTGQQIAERPELIRSIHAEMELIKRNRLAFMFIFSLWLRKVWRFRARRAALIAAKPRRCQTSMVFSNMGRIFETSRLSITSEGQVQAGQLKLTGLEVLAPIAPLMHVAIMTFHYAGRITLSLRYDGQAISATTAARLLQRIAERIEIPVPEMSQA